MQKVKIGTRGSILAIKQAMMAQNVIEQQGNITTEIVKIKTSGDMIKHGSLADIGGKGLFLKELEQALIDNRIDIAVHSMKDIPAVIDPRLVIAGVMQRDDPRDAFISHYHNRISELPVGSTIGTCSPRRIAQLKTGLQGEILRGNVNSRLKKSKNFDGIILAVAGLNRLGLQDRITEIISVDEMLPAVGQGVICLQCRQNDSKYVTMLNKISHLETKIAIVAERAFLEKINGDCTTPLAALATIKDNQINLQVMLEKDGTNYFTKRCGNISEAKLLGEDAATELLLS